MHPEIALAKKLEEITHLARIAHETNRGYCIGLGDFSQLPWEHAPKWQQESAIKGVLFVLENPDAPASANHDSWLEHKRKEGWKYGPVKNPETKEHPCFVPYGELPADQRCKDVIFKTVVLGQKRIFNP